MDTINEFLGVDLIWFDTIQNGLWMAGTNVEKPAKKFPQGLEMGKSVGVFIKAPSI